MQIYIYELLPVYQQQQKDHFTKSLREEHFYENAILKLFYF